MNKSNNSIGKWLVINNKVYTINYQLSLADLIAFLKYTNPGLVCEHNLKIVIKFDEKIKIIENLDKIELVTIVGGG